MNATKKNKNAMTMNGGRAVAVISRPGLTIDVSGTVPGVSRIEIRRWSRTILRHLEQKTAELSLAFVTDQTIHELNSQYRNKDKPTDVLSFPLADDLYPWLLGDVVISIDTAQRQAWRRRHSLREEVLTLLIHGILHLLGYDHEISRSEAIRMHKKERAVQAFVENQRP